MSQSELQEITPLKISILMNWIRANDSIALTANIKWIDWIITHYKPEKKFLVSDAIQKLSDLEDELITKMSNKIVIQKKAILEKRSNTAYRKLTSIPLFCKPKDKKISILGTIVDEDTGITITLGDIKQILSNITRSTILTSYIIDSYEKAGTWIEKISPDVCCYYESSEGVAQIGSIGEVAVADALSLLVEPYSYQCGYTLKDESKVESLYNKLLHFRKVDKFGVGFLPGADIEHCYLPVVESTAIASITLCNYHSYLKSVDKTDKLNEVEKEIEPVINWLKGHQFEEGYWSTYKSNDYKPYPSVQATQLALIALSSAPNMNSDTEKHIKRSISYIKKNEINGGWGIDFRDDEYDLIATARIIWALMVVFSSEKNELNDVIETAMKRFISEITEYKELYHIDKIYIPNENGTRSRASIDWYISARPFIMSTVLRYYAKFKEGNIDEDINKFIQNGILEITSKQHPEFGCWSGTPDGINENFSPSSTYYYASTLFHKAMLDYTYLKSALKVKE